jgi:hypothetical protein
MMKDTDIFASSTGNFALIDKKKLAFSAEKQETNKAVSYVKNKLITVEERLRDRRFIMLSIH